MRKLVIIFLIFLMSMAWSVFTNAQANCDKEASATVISLQGNVTFNANGAWHEAQLNDTLCEGTKIWVKPNSRISVALPGYDVLRLKENTLLTLKIINLNQTSLLDVVKGFIHFISRKPKEVKIESGIANAAPLGTEFAFSVDDNKAALWVYEGGVKFYNQHGSVNLNSGQAAEALLGKAPKLRIDIKPQDAVNWALYYPPLLPSSDGLKAPEPIISKAIDDYRKGRIDLALQSLATLSPAQQTPHFHKVRGALRLIVGQVDLAWQDIKALQADKPTDAEALALQSVIALTQNHKDQAHELASKAVNANPQSATAYTALSYAEQEQFNLEKAQAAADKAAELAPQDAMALARKAELQLSQGLISDSEQTVQKAINLDTNLERTQTIKGFTHLMKMDTNEAMQAFDKAVTLDSTSPLARLGLGVAKIRDGELEEGRKDLEIAANLDPNNSLIRSYLGKAYYEEKRSDRAEEQFKLAKERDPKDPTAYFYNAIEKQTTNRPVEALHDMQRAIELNDNRGVYRSSLAMDKDLAARSAAQGRIYSELGFQQQGLLEGWKSVNQGTSNYSAHRLLADTYAALPRHEIARVSELLQSQLLQPVNITPIQPNLAESNLFILNGLGPSDQSYNEFNPLFEYNRFALQTSGLVGGNNTWGDNVTLSGIHDDVSFSLGQLHFETDGFRENNVLKKDLYNAFIQGRVSENFNLQAEYRHEERENGDLALNFDLNNFSKDFNDSTNVDSYRIGGHYLLSPDSSFLASLIYQEVENFRNETLNEVDGRNLFKEVLNRNGFISELQHSFVGSKLNSSSGFGHINQSTTTQDFEFGVWEPPSKLNTKRTNFYNYSKFNIIKNLRATIGVSFDFLNIGDFLEKNRVHPKFGIEWSPDAFTTVRAASFRNTSITRIANQTIEPTQVAGFNQFFDDINGTIAWRYGAGIDHRFSKYISSGVEYTERQLNLPGEQAGRSEQQARSYINFTPFNQLALIGEYFYERIDQSSRSMNRDLGFFHLVETHKLPLTVSFFHSSGISVKLKNTFVHQSGLFNIDNLCTSDCTKFAPGNSNFFIVDLNLSYRLPKRYGMISFGIDNLFDERFNFQNTEINTNQGNLAPGRLIFSRLTLAF